MNSRSVFRPAVIAVHQALIAECHEETAGFGGYLWIIHSQDSWGLARRWRDRSKTARSTKAGSNDRWVPFRQQLEEVAAAVGMPLARIERREDPLRTARQGRAA